MLAYAFEALVDIVVCKTENMKIDAFEVSCSRFVVEKTVFCIMLRAIDFDDEFCATAIKIDNIPGKLFLPAEAEGMIAQKIIP